MSAALKPQRYWGIFVFSVVFTLLQMAFGAKASAVQILWVVVAYHAYKGNAAAIVRNAKIAIWIQVVVGGAFLVANLVKPNILYELGPWKSYLLSIGIPTVFWVVLLFRSLNLRDRQRGDTDVATEDELDRQRRVDKSDSENASNLVNSTLPAREIVTQTQHRPTPQQITAFDAIKTERQDTYKQAKLVIEYSDEAKIAWRAAQSLPAEFQDQFLQSLESDGSRDPQELVRSLEQSYHRLRRPFDNDLANDALEDVRTISDEAAQEFISAYLALGDRAEIGAIVEKIERKFGLTKKTRDRIASQQAETARLLQARKLEEQKEASRREAGRIQMKASIAARREAKITELRRLDDERQEKKIRWDTSSAAYPLNDERRFFRVFLRVLLWILNSVVSIQFLLCSLILSFIYIFFIKF